MYSHLVARCLLLCLVAGGRPATFGQMTAFEYQGRLIDSGQPAAGTYDLRFVLHGAGSEENPLGEPSTNRAVHVVDGRFNVTLDFGAEVFSGGPRWLEIGVCTNGAAEFSALHPRQPLRPTPYAIAALHFAGVLPSGSLAGTYSGALTLDNPANQLAGDGSGLRFGPDARGIDDLPFYWNVRGNAGTNPDLNFLGTTDRQPLEIRVDGRRALRLEPAPGVPNVIGGHESNRVEGGGHGMVIGGGGSESAPHVLQSGGSEDPALAPMFSTIAGGEGHTVRAASYATIGGGAGHTISEPRFRRFQFRVYNTIAGGVGHGIAEAFDSTIAGGRGNRIAGEFESDHVEGCTIGGGNGNVIGTLEDDVQQATIAGGKDNRVTRSSYATIGGGQRNAIDVDSTQATVAGGSDHAIGPISESATIGGGAGSVIEPLASGATISGGVGNRVTRPEIPRLSYAAISGGRSNLAVGSYAAVAGGFANCATNYSLAAGHQAKALHDGSFVWAAGNSNDFPSFADNRVHFYAPGGLEVAYGGQSASGRGRKWVVLASQAPGRVINAFNGAHLSEGGAWTDNADRADLEDLEAVEPQQILARVAELPLYRWSYRAETNGTRHLSPPAQDFRRLFGLGLDDQHIASLDSSGVALAAIQGLIRRLEDKQKEIDQLNRRVTRLERRLSSDKSTTTSTEPSEPED